MVGKICIRFQGIKEDFDGNSNGNVAKAKV